MSRAEGKADVEIGAEARWGYRPHLDGIRAIAVYLVVAFHAGADRLSGGFIGVDIFFVLSGYLVTKLLLRDLDGPDRRVRFGNFYSRRARRLLPAAALNLIVTAVVFAWVGAPVEFADATNGIRAASLYFANWHFIAQSSDYFAANVDTSPVLHYWSLSVEEQFYLLWPLLLAGLYAATRFAGARRHGVLRLVLAGAALGSAAAALHLSHDNLSRAYYGTDTRAYQLLAGAFIAVSPGFLVRLRRSRLAGPAILPIISGALLTGLLVLATSLIDLDAIRRGILVTVLMVGLILSLEAGNGGLPQRLLSLAPITYLGRISYGIYLWHWLVIVVLTREASLGPVPTLLIAAVAATGLASVSYHVVEVPIRTARLLDRVKPATIACGLATSLLVGLVIAPVVLDNSQGPDTVANAAGQDTGSGTGTQAISRSKIGRAYFDIYDAGKCKVSGPVACPITKGKGKTAIVVGESHAKMFTPMLADLAQRHDVSLFAGYLAYCPWTRGLQYYKVGPNCFRDQANLFDKIIPALDPDIVFLAHRAVDDVNSTLDLTDQTEGKLKGDEARRAALDHRISDLVDSLRRAGRTVVMFEPIPVVNANDNTLTCMSKSRSVKACSFRTRATPGMEEKLMQRLAAEDEGVVSVNLDRFVCPALPRCDPVVNGLIVKRDDNHMTVTFARSLVDPVDRYLTAQGVFG